jgi:hypothetical protein
MRRRVDSSSGVTFPEVSHVSARSERADYRYH